MIRARISSCTFSIKYIFIWFAKVFTITQKYESYIWKKNCLTASTLLSIKYIMTCIHAGYCKIQRKAGKVSCTLGQRLLLYLPECFYWFLCIKFSCKANGLVQSEGCITTYNFTWAILWLSAREFYFIAVLDEFIGFIDGWCYYSYCNNIIPLSRKITEFV